MTDTLPTEKIVGFARKVDLLVGEGMYGDDSMREKMGEKGHMLFSDSARIARDAGAKRLWLTHYSPALTEPEAYLDAVREIFSETYAAYDGIQITL
jgi:ribonuclease Z